MGNGWAVFSLHFAFMGKIQGLEMEYSTLV